jgi:hypothetical protein
MNAIYFPWIVFLLGTALLIWQGFRTKGQYLQRKTKEQERARMAEEQDKARAIRREDALLEALKSSMAREDRLVTALKAREGGQDRPSGLEGTLGGGGQTKGTGYGKPS